jgi:hypothetical protein
MPVMAIYQSDDVSADDYAAFRARLPLTAAPRGALVHSHAERGRGRGFITVEVWEDRASLDDFLENVLAPAVRRMGLPLIRPEVLEVDDFIVTPGVHNREIPFGRMRDYA